MRGAIQKIGELFRVGLRPVLRTGGRTWAALRVRPPGTMAVQLAAGVRERIVAHALDERPNECCGLLVGRGLVIEECVPAANVDADPGRRYRIDPATHIAVNRRLRGSGQRVVGAYHSHPRTAATPSESDVSEATYPEFVWLIVSLQHDTPSLLAYRVEAGTVVPLRMLDGPLSSG